MPSLEEGPEEDSVTDMVTQSDGIAHARDSRTNA